MARILVLDDSRDVLSMARDLLGEEHEVHTAGSWSTAFRDLTSNTFDLILLDVELPGLQGNEIASILSGSLLNREQDSSVRTRTQVILFSAMDKAKLKRLASESDVDGYLPKDFSNLALLKRKINRILND